MRSLRLLPALLLVVSGCSSAEDNGPAPGPGTTTPPSTDLPPWDADPCAHLAGGPAGTHAPAADLGRAHSYARYFGIEKEGRLADAKLADALDANEPSAPGAVTAYAKSAGSASMCAAASVDASFGPASVTIHDGVAVVVPGTGAVPAIPADVKAVALDVRSLGDGDDARAAVLAAFAAIVPSDLQLLDAEVRTCNGQPDEVWTVSVSPVDQYACTAGHVDGDTVKGKAPAAKPLAVLTAPKLTPLAAWTAATLRARASAFVIGDSVPASIAESRWLGIGKQGLAVRTQRLFAGKQPIPDVIEADVRSSDPLRSLAAFDFSADRGALAGEAKRPAIVDGVRPKEWGARGDRVGDARAALVTAHAAVRAFYPYFADVGDDVDARLDEALGMIAGDLAKDRAKVLVAVARFGEALHDGHAFPQDHYRAARTSFTPVALLPLGADLVVAASSTRSPETSSSPSTASPRRRSSTTRFGSRVDPCIMHVKSQRRRSRPLGSPSS